MSTTIQGSFEEPVPVKLVVTDALGGIAGLTVTVVVRDNLTRLALDFSDLTFKAVGHTTPQITLTDEGAGRYVLPGGVDPYLWTLSGARPNPPIYFELEYSVTGPRTAEADDLLLVVASLGGEEITQSIDTTGNDGLGWQEVQTNEAGREIRRFNLYRDASGSEERIPPTFTTTQFKQAKELIIKRELV